MNKGVLMGVGLLVVAAMGVPQSAHADRRLSALFSAVETGDLQGVRKMLEDGMQVDSRNPDGLTPLMVAALAGRADVVRELLASGADVNARVDFYGITALTLAGRHGSESEIVALLVRAGATPEVQDERSRILVIVTELE